QLPHPRFSKALPLAKSPPKHPERPHQERSEGEQEGGKQAQKRAQKSKSGARPDIGPGWLRAGMRGVARPHQGRQTKEENKPADFHRSFPSRNGTSRTFGCWIGPWPKYPSSPNSSPWSEVIVMYVFRGARSNNSSTTPSR